MYCSWSITLTACGDVMSKSNIIDWNGSSADDHTNGKLLKSGENASVIADLLIDVTAAGMSEATSGGMVCATVAGMVCVTVAGMVCATVAGMVCATVAGMVCATVAGMVCATVAGMLEVTSVGMVHATVGGVTTAGIVNVTTVATGLMVDNCGLNSSCCLGDSHCSCHSRITGCCDKSRRDGGWWRDKQYCTCIFNYHNAF